MRCLRAMEPSYTGAESGRSAVADCRLAAGCCDTDWQILCGQKTRVSQRYLYISCSADGLAGIGHDLWPHKTSACTPVWLHPRRCHCRGASDGMSGVVGYISHLALMMICHKRQLAAPKADLTGPMLAGSEWLSTSMGRCGYVPFWDCADPVLYSSRQRCWAMLCHCMGVPLFSARKVGVGYSLSMQP